MNPAEMIDDVIAVAKEAGEYIRNERKNFDRAKVEQKSGFSDLVSYVDKEAEKMIVSRLSQIFPEAGFIGEEGVANERKEGHNWIIDPLDGTTNFLHGLPVFCVSIALADGKAEKLGVVYEINLDECFYATKGGGAFCNGKPIRVSPAVTLEESLIATGFPYQIFEKMPQYLEIINHFMRHTHGIRRLGAAAADLAYVASGRLEGFFEFGLKPWDMAAGTLLIKEAGGRVADFDAGDDYLFGAKGLISGCAVFPEIVETIHRYWYENEKQNE